MVYLILFPKELRVSKYLHIGECPQNRNCHLWEPFVISKWIWEEFSR